MWTNVIRESMLPDQRSGQRTLLEAIEPPQRIIEQHPAALAKHPALRDAPVLQEPAHPLGLHHSWLL